MNTTNRDCATLVEQIRQGDRTATFERLNAVAERPDIEVYFRSDYGSFSAALKSLDIGDWLAWDADEFNHHSWHAIARQLQMRIATKKHEHISATIVMRIA